MKTDIEEIKKQIIYDFIRFKSTKNDKFKNSVSEALKRMSKHYHAGVLGKVAKIEDFDALNQFIAGIKPAKQIINQIYSNLWD